jgi:hypothetical protein
LQAPRSRIQEGAARPRATFGCGGKTSPEIRAALEHLTDIPVDIAPVFVAAGEN